MSAHSIEYYHQTLNIRKDAITSIDNSGQKTPAEPIAPWCKPNLINTAPLMAIGEWLAPAIFNATCTSVDDNSTDNILLFVWTNNM